MVNRRTEVIPGEGLTLRFGQQSAWIGPGASAALVAFLVGHARELSGNPYPGPELANRLERVLRNTDPEPAVAFVVVGAAPGGLEALLHGPVQLWDGTQWAVLPSGKGWRRITFRGDGPVVAAAAGSAPPRLLLDSPVDLISGVVPGSGVALVPAPGPVVPGGPGAVPFAAGRSAGAGAGQAGLGPVGQAGVAPVGQAGVAPVGQAGVAPVGPGPESSAHLGSGPADSEEWAQGLAAAEVVPEVDPPHAPGGAPQADPAASPPAEPAESAGSANSSPDEEPVGPNQRGGGVEVLGIRCPKGHFNPPTARYCVACGSTLTPDVVSGVRPPLGVLVLDDGSTYNLDSGYVIGSSPEDDDAVLRGEERPLRLPVPEDRVSAVHAEVRLVDWDVQLIDRGSATGTFVLPPGAPQWLPVAPGTPVVLSPKSHVACGRRVFAFESQVPS